MRKLICFLVLILIPLAMSCGGGSSSGSGSSATISPVNTGTAPTISNLRYFPQTSKIGDGGGSVTITAYVDFVDPDGDVTRGTVTIYDANTGASSVQVANFTNLSGRTFGTVGIISIGNSTLAKVSYNFDIRLNDAAGHQSNKLAGSFQVI